MSSCPPTPPSPSASLSGRRVLISGAGGSIGAALARAVALHEPASLILLDSSEFALYEIDRGLRFPHISILGSTQDSRLLADLFARHRPQVVLHTAAYKHVPMLERNPFAAIENNVFGTRTLLHAATCHLAQDFLLVSTDKAVEPRSIMGASKRVAELLLLTHRPGLLRVTAIRLGNVWGSQGSVVQLFREQIAAGGPITLTDSSATRYFLSLDQAVHHILCALAPRAAGVVLLPSLDPPRAIADLARSLLETEGSEAAMVLTGLRPGDKLTESLLSPDECFLPTPSSEASLRAILSPIPNGVGALLLDLQKATLHRDLPALLRVLTTLVPAYTPGAELLLQAQP